MARLFPCNRISNSMRCVFASLLFFLACDRSSAHPDEDSGRADDPAAQSRAVSAEPPSDGGAASQAGAAPNSVQCPNGRNVGETWKEQCNTCQCGEDGKANCTIMFCGEPRGDG
jgi:hypothetical protein